MSTYIIRRLIQAVIVIIIVTVIIFLLLRVVPGDPLQYFLTEADIASYTEEQLEALRIEFGLDKSIAWQYTEWVSNIIRGDFGKSLIYKYSVIKLMIQRFPVSIHLGLWALLISTVVGIGIGLISALRRGSILDMFLSSFASLGISIPIFWLGIMMIYLFGLYLRWLPIHGYTSPFEDFSLAVKQMIMPVICLSIISIAGNARQTRSAMLEVIRQDYIRTAWAKGLRERAVVMRHALKNGLIPVVTLIGGHVGHIVGGSVLIETVFNIPGAGRVMVTAVTAHDYPVVQGLVLVISVVVVLVNLLVDISYGWLDPRIRYA